MASYGSGDGERMRRLPRAWRSALALCALLVGVPVRRLGGRDRRRSIARSDSSRAWIDVFDYAPRLQNAGAAPRITPDSMSDMAALGVRTLYVQVANPDGAPPNQLTDRAELRALLERAHDEGIAIVPWFLPSLTKPADDVA